MTASSCTAKPGNWGQRPGLGPVRNYEIARSRLRGERSMNEKLEPSGPKSWNSTEGCAQPIDFIGAPQGNRTPVSGVRGR